MTETLLNLSDVSLSYDGTPVVEHVNLQIVPGEILCIVGESGSGKTSLLRGICDAGEVQVDGGEISFHNDQIPCCTSNDRRKALGCGIGIIMQNPSGTFNPLRRFDVQIREMMQSHGMSYQKEDVIGLFEQMGLTNGEEILTSRPYEMSGGMNQRIAIASTMLLEPKLLLCDEPTSALDVTSAGLVVELLCRYRKKYNVGILMVTHNLGIAYQMADTIGIMRSGRMVEYGAAREIFHHPKEEYTKQLLHDVPKLAGYRNE
ncbi:MAG: ABC transporter ATP-binding protein [Lachnospiraceae bacterium]|nr:ABC transporter ATP-binding protein [Lachnospiraceae bacterium]